MIYKINNMQLIYQYRPHILINSGAIKAEEIVTELNVTELINLRNRLIVYLLLVSSILQLT
jgi:hypothetical protein